MKKKLIQHGNSLALIIDKPILELMGITKKTELTISIDGDTITIKTPTKKEAKKPEFSNKKLQKLHEEIAKQYAEACRVNRETT